MPLETRNSPSRWLEEQIMKKFSEIRSKLSHHGYLGETHVRSQDLDKAEDLLEENWGVGVHPHPAADDVDLGNLLNLNDERTLNQLNAFVGSVAHRDYMDPLVPMKNLQNKLQMIGLNFDFNESSLYQDGSIDYPLNRFANITGFSKKLDGTFIKNHKSIDEEEGISYVLQVSSQKLLNGLTSIRAQVRRMNP